MLESELFGHEQFAFTDAKRAKTGLFQTANGGVLFLDEIGLLPPALQPKLLKVLDEGAVRRLGATRNEVVDVGIITATNEDLQAAMKEKRFREDLYSRLAVLILEVPPLRAREGDVELLADSFLARACQDYGIPPKLLGPDARSALRAYTWPGNVRELRNLMLEVALQVEATTVTAQALRLPQVPPVIHAGEGDAGEAIDRELLIEALSKTKWNISRTASLLGITRKTVRARVQRYGLQAPEGVRGVHIQRLRSSGQSLVVVMAAEAVRRGRRIALRHEDTAQALLQYQGTISATAQHYNGRVVPRAGNTIVAEFSSAFEAVSTGLVILESFEEHDATIRSEGDLALRIGVGVGQLFDARDEVLNQVVNETVRLQQLASPGQVLVTSDIYDVLHDRAELEFRPVSSLKLKALHVANAYEVRWRRRIAKAAHAGARPVFAERSSALPRLVVRPFRPLGSDPEAVLVADSITQQLLASLSALSSSMEVYETDVNVPFVRTYVLTGTIERAEVFRVTAKLTELFDSRSLWSQSYDCDTKERVRIQSEIVRDTLKALQINLTEGEQARLWHRSTRSLVAWESFQQGKQLERRFRRESHQQAGEWYRQAIDADPQYVAAIVALGFCIIDEIRLGWVVDEEQSLAAATVLVRDAERIDSYYPELYALKGFLHLVSGRTKEAIAAGQLAIGLAPRSSEMAAYLGTIYRAAGQYDEAISWYRRARELSPTDPPWIACNLGNVYLFMGRHGDAETYYEEVLGRDPEYLSAHVGLIVTSVRSDQRDRAVEHAQRVLQIDPLFDVERWARRYWSVSPGILDEMMRSLKSAGLP
jgi:tetratricopeptide (TPR) repeat protein/class 3 adenylate cyclase